MNRRPADIDARLAAWLEEGPTSGPEEVLTRTLARARSTRQDRVRLHRLTQPTRFHAMNTLLKVAAVAVFALALGVTVLPRASDVGTAPAPSPSPSPSPMPLGGYAPDLAAGTYYQPIWDGPGHWTVTVPEGWEVFYGILWKNVDGKSDPDSVGGPGAVTLSWEEPPVNVVADPCHWKDSLADPPVGPTVDDLANAFAEQVGSDPSGPTDVTLGGYPAKRIELMAPADLDMATCDEAAYSLWGGGDRVTADVAGEVTVLYILDVEGDRMVMRTWHRPDASAEDLAELEAMLASSRIDPPASSPAASGSPAALVWSPASLEQDWPTPVRTEPVGHFVVRWDGEYTDPAGDIGSSDIPWIDIQSVTEAGSGVMVELGGDIPVPVPEPAEQWTAYGLIFDTDRDGVADLRLGVDVGPDLSQGHEPGMGDTTAGGADGSLARQRTWQSDLATGELESGWVCDCLFPGLLRNGSVTLYAGEYPARFYVWASMIEDGRVVATDYAPDSGWLEATP